MASGDTRKRYRVLEGNRRLLAIKALETPTLISPVLSSAASNRLTALSARYAKKSIASIACALFESEEEARHWIFLRHTGENKGAGLVTWGSEEKARFEATHTGKKKPAVQVIEFVEAHGSLSAAAQSSKQRIQTNIERLVETTAVREKLGIDVVEGEVVSLYPLEEVVKGLTRIVEDLKTKKVTVTDIYHAKQREEYVDGFSRSALPRKKTALDQPVILGDLTAGRRPRKVKAPSKPKRKKSASRTAVIPAGGLNISPPRINAVYNELLTMNAEQYPNACSVLLRVLVELSVDHYLEDKKAMTEHKIDHEPLKVRMKATARHLKENGSISNSLKRAVNAMADGQSVLSPGLPNFNQYVHNKYTFPKPSELYLAWDELTPFMEKLWP